MSNTVEIKNVDFKFDRLEIESMIFNVARKYRRLFILLDTIFSSVVLVSCLAGLIILNRVISEDSITVEHWHLAIVLIGITITISSSLLASYCRAKLRELKVWEALPLCCDGSIEEWTIVAKKLCEICDDWFLLKDDLFMLNCIWYIHENKDKSIFVDTKEHYAYVQNSSIAFDLDLLNIKDSENPTLYITTENIYVM